MQESFKIAKLWYEEILVTKLMPKVPNVSFVASAGH